MNNEPLCNSEKDCNCVKCRDNKVFYCNICTVYSKNNTDNINSLNYAVTQSESKEILHNLIDGNDYELTVEVEEEYFSNIYSFYKNNDISEDIDYKQNVSNCNNSIVDCSDESRHTCINVNTSHSSDITVNRSISDSNDITGNRSVSDSNDNCNNLLSLNCCGIKSRLQYPGFQNLIRNHDILCFVETKTNDLDVINFPGFKFIMKNRKNIAYRRSGGIMVGYRDTLVNMIEIKETSCKYVLWFKCKGELLKLDQPVIFGAVYTQSTHQMKHLMKFNKNTYHF